MSGQEEQRLGKHGGEKTVSRTSTPPKKQKKGEEDTGKADSESCIPGNTLLARGHAT